jgi:hypothetical protein
VILLYTWQRSTRWRSLFTLAGLFCARAAVVLFLILPLTGFAAIPAVSLPKADPVSMLSPAETRARLQLLEQLVARCRQAMTAANCQGGQVGADFQVAESSGNRMVRLGWLRELLNEAGAGPSKNDQPVHPKPVKTASPVFVDEDYAPPSVAQRLDDARKRLGEDAEWVGLNGQNGPTGLIQSRRAALAGILSAREYHAAVAKRSLGDRIREKIANWLNWIIGKLVAAGAKSKWIGTAAEIGFVLVLCIALAWFLIRLERQGRFRPSSIGAGIGMGAASARDWQLWLEDARAAAARGAWRDAIHLLYWASISRLESSGLWPADRARTPREYLALVSRQSPHYAGLGALTRSFERTWYAGRSATEEDFHQAEELAGQLGAKASSRLDESGRTQ